MASIASTSSNSGSSGSSNRSSNRSNRSQSRNHREQSRPQPTATTGSTTEPTTNRKNNFQMSHQAGAGVTSEKSESKVEEPMTNRAIRGDKCDTYTNTNAQELTSNRDDDPLGSPSDEQTSSAKRNINSTCIQPSEASGAVAKSGGSDGESASSLAFDYLTSRGGVGGSKVERQQQEQRLKQIPESNDKSPKFPVASETGSQAERVTVEPTIGQNGDMRTNRSSEGAFFRTNDDDDDDESAQGYNEKQQARVTADKYENANRRSHDRKNPEKADISKHDVIEAFPRIPTELAQSETQMELPLDGSDEGERDKQVNPTSAGANMKQEERADQMMPRPQRKLSVFSSSGFPDLKLIEESARQQRTSNAAPIESLQASAANASSQTTTSGQQVEQLGGSTSGQQQQEKQSRDQLMKARRSTRLDTFGSTGSSRASSCDEPTITATNSSASTLNTNSLRADSMAVDDDEVFDETSEVGMEVREGQSSMVDGSNCNSSQPMGDISVSSSSSLDSIGWTDQTSISPDSSAVGSKVPDKTQNESELPKQSQQSDSNGKRKFESIKSQLKGNNNSLNAQLIQRHIDKLISQNEAIIDNWNLVSIRSYNHSSSRENSTSSSPKRASTSIPPPLLGSSQANQLGTSQTKRWASTNEQPTQITPSIALPLSASNSPDPGASHRLGFSSAYSNLNQNQLSLSDSRLGQSSVSRKRSYEVSNRYATGTCKPQIPLAMDASFNSMLHNHQLDQHRLTSLALEHLEAANSRIQSALQNSNDQSDRRWSNLCLSQPQLAMSLVTNSHNKQPDQQLEEAIQNLSLRRHTERQQQQQIYGLDLLQKSNLMLNPQQQQQHQHHQQNSPVPLAPPSSMLSQHQQQADQQIAMAIAALHLEQHQKLEQQTQMVERQQERISDQLSRANRLSQTGERAAFSNGHNSPTPEQQLAVIQELLSVLRNQQQQHQTPFMTMEHSGELLTQSLDSATPSHKCQLCGMAFWTRDLLNYHQLTQCHELRLGLSLFSQQQALAKSSSPPMATLAEHDPSAENLRSPAIRVHRASDCRNPMAAEYGAQMLELLKSQQYEQLMAASRQLEIERLRNLLPSGCQGAQQQASNSISQANKSHQISSSLLFPHESLPLKKRKISAPNMM